MLLRRNFLKGILGSIFSGGILSADDIVQSKENIPPIPKFIKVNKYKFPVLIYSHSKVCLNEIKVIYDMVDYPGRRVSKERVYVFNNGINPISDLLYRFRLDIDSSLSFSFRERLERTTICIADDWSSGFCFVWGKIISLEKIDKSDFSHSEFLQNDNNWKNIEFIY